MIRASLCLSAAVRTLDEPIVVKLRFLNGVPLFYALVRRFEGNRLTQRHQITSLETIDHRLPCSENPESLSHLGLIRYRVVTSQTNRQTDRIPIANTRSQQYLPVQLSRVKTLIANKGAPVLRMRGVVVSFVLCSYNDDKLRQYF